MESLAQVFRTLAPQIILIHHRQVMERTQLLIRFANGFGAALLPVFPAEADAFWEMLVLRFHGPKIKDHKLLQYGPVPEFNRGNIDEIVELCRQVSLLPPNRSWVLCPSRSSDRSKKEGREKRCSNF